MDQGNAPPIILLFLSRGWIARKSGIAADPSGKDKKMKIDKIDHSRKISRIRAIIQVGFTLFCLQAGYRFYHFYLWTQDRSEIFSSRPPSVEAFLPISALLALKRLVLTGLWDRVHPAGLTILLAALVIAWLLRKGFCGWICPVGAVSNLLEKLGKSISIRLPKPIEYPLLGLKYLLLAFFVYIIFLKMDLPSIDAFIHSPYNMVADAKMLEFFLQPSSLTLGVIGFLFLISIAVRNFWCRYLCPYGALLGLLAIFSPLQVRRKASRCIDCRKCDKICPAFLKISNASTLRHPECIGCMECIEVCPQKDCLTLETGSWRKLPIHAVPLAVVGLFALFYLAAVLTGNWDTSIPPEMLKRLYQSGSTFAHP